jgi:hypothetical protein
MDDFLTINEIYIADDVIDDKVERKRKKRSNKDEEGKERANNRDAVDG